MRQSSHLRVAVFIRGKLCPGSFTPNVPFDKHILLIFARFKA
jgi:hypothetical protein